MKAMIGPQDYDAATGHELSDCIVDNDCYFCRYCGRVIEKGYLERMQPEDLLIEAYCEATVDDLPKDICTCGVGIKWRVGHSKWCKLHE